LISTRFLKANLSQRFGFVWYTYKQQHMEAYFCGDICNFLIKAKRSVNRHFLPIFAQRQENTRILVKTHR
jgi:hypothetical protein